MQSDVLFRDTVADLSIFRLITDSKSKAAKKPDAEVPLEPNVLLAEGLLADISTTRASFLSMYTKALAAMDKENRELHRQSDDLVVRLVSVSALLWNHRSKAKPRDWGLIAIAFALEAAYILTYRMNLLLECPGARLVRAALHKLLLPLAEAFVDPDSHTLITHWDFADGLGVPANSSDASVGSFNDLLARWKFARNRHALGEKDPAFDLIRTLERNKYLQSSVDGSLESMAHHYITGLAEVRLPLPFLPCFFTLSLDHF